MTRIILPVDFMHQSDILINEAIEFAKKMNGTLHLIHIAATDIGFAIGDMGFQYFPEIEQNEIRQELQQLRDMEEYIKSQGVECDHILKQGIAKETILEYAKEKNADYIAMGSHGRSGIYDIVIGSLTKEITKSSHIPVLVIPIRD